MPFIGINPVVVGDLTRKSQYDRGFDNGIDTGQRAIYVGAIVMTTAASCPSGYSVYSTIDGTFLRGAATFQASAGGSTAHVHDITHDHAAVNTGGGSSSVGGSGGGSFNPVPSHSHGSGIPSTFTGDTDSAEHLPLFSDVKLCKFDDDGKSYTLVSPVTIGAGTRKSQLDTVYNNADVTESRQVFTGQLAFSSVACPSGWTRFAALDGTFLQANATYSAVVGGTDNHSHGYDHTHTATTGAASGVVAADRASGANHPADGHGHPWTSGSPSINVTDIINNNPTHTDIIVCMFDGDPGNFTYNGTKPHSVGDATKKSAYDRIFEDEQHNDENVLFTGAFLMQEGAICPTGWTRASGLDGRFLKAAVTFTTFAGGTNFHSQNFEHTHPVTTGLSNNNPPLAGGAGALANVTHTHTFTLQQPTGGTTSSFDEVVPPYSNLVFCQKD